MWYCLAWSRIAYSKISITNLFTGQIPWQGMMRRWICQWSGNMSVVPACGMWIMWRQGPIIWCVMIGTNEREEMLPILRGGGNPFESDCEMKYNDIAKRYVRACVNVKRARPEVRGKRNIAIYHRETGKCPRHSGWLCLAYNQMNLALKCVGENRRKWNKVFYDEWIRNQLWELSRPKCGVHACY